MPTQFPESPWFKIATDLFEFKQQNYLLVVDYYFRFIEIAKLESTTATSVINHLKSIFVRFGIPKCVVSDNGPQYSCKEFSSFAHSYEFTHITSSPGHSSGNGEAERAVHTVKQLLRGSDDPYGALLSYRATPLSNGASPAELLMCRRLRTKVPTIPSSLKPKPLDDENLQRKEETYRMKQKLSFDRHHATRHLSPLGQGQEIFIPDRKQFGTVVNNYGDHDRSYIVKTESGLYRRNRVQLNHIPPQQPHVDADEPQITKKSNSVPAAVSEPVCVDPPPTANHSGDKISRSRSGRVLMKPKRLEDCMLK